MIVEGGYTMSNLNRYLSTSSDRFYRIKEGCLHLAYALSQCDLEEVMAERGILVDHSTLYRWIIRFNKAF
ncbi:hypothetical protein CF113_09910 [Aeromonas veronii]|nr:hypothetical protein CF113_09910 [Aeromonas veronii]